MATTHCWVRRYHQLLADLSMFVSHPLDPLLMSSSSFGRQFTYSPCHVLPQGLVPWRWHPLPSCKYKPQRVGALAALHATLKQYGTQKVDKCSSLLSSSGKFQKTLCRLPSGIKSLVARSSDLYNILSILGFPFSLSYSLDPHSCFLGSLPK